MPALSSPAAAGSVLSREVKSRRGGEGHGCERKGATYGTGFHLEDVSSHDVLGKIDGEHASTETLGDSGC